MKDVLNRFVNWQPLSLRGLLAIIVAILALKLIAIPSMDLVTFALAGPILFIVLLSAALCLFFGRRIKKRIEAELNFDGSALYSNTVLSFGILFRGSSVPPFFTLKVKRDFEPEAVETQEHYLKGSESKTSGRRIIDTIRFPHRGIWNLKGLSFELMDPFGFSRFRWNKNLDLSLPVSPPNLAIRPLPIIASSSKAGDEMSLPKERTGDLFDIKQYDPADGVSRILWKTYARTRELYVRRPEPAIIPEGEVAIYLVAGAYEDHVAAAAISYIDYLIDNDIVVLFGTDGSELDKRFASNREDILSMIRGGAMAQNAGSAKGFIDYLEALEASNREMKQFVIFASKPSGGNQLAPSWFGNITDIANRVGARICLAQVPQTLAPMFWKQQSAEEKGLLRELLEQYENYRSGPKESVFHALPHDATYFDVESDESYARR